MLLNSSNELQTERTGQKMSKQAHSIEDMLYNENYLTATVWCECGWKHQESSMLSEREAFKTLRVAFKQHVLSSAGL
jgi:C4-type Zn-finger protein